MRFFKKTIIFYSKNYTYRELERTSSVTFERRKTGIVQLYKNQMIKPCHKTRRQPVIRKFGGLMTS